MDEQRDEPSYPCPSMEMCCKIQIINDQREVGADEVQKSSELVKSIRNFLQQTPTSTDKAAELEVNEVCKVNQPKKCGLRNENGLGSLEAEIQNKTRYAKYAEFPWAIVVMRNTKVGNKMFKTFKMGGSLIHPRVVLTTAHQLNAIDPTKIVIRAGEWDTQSDAELCKHEERKVEKVIVHEMFTRENLQNDDPRVGIPNDISYQHHLLASEKYQLRSSAMSCWGLG